MCTRLLLIPWSFAGVPSNRALQGFPITAPPPADVPDVIGALAVWRQNKTKKINMSDGPVWFGSWSSMRLDWPL